MKSKILLLSLSILNFLFLEVETLIQQIKLSQNWSLSIEGISQQYPVKIPSTLTDDLIQHGLVSSQPYYRDNFLQFYNFQTKGAIYSTYFISPSEDKCNNELGIEIQFQGLDTHAQVYFNSKLIIIAHNMYRKYRAPVQLLGPGQKNNITVKFNSSALYDVEQQIAFKQKIGVTLPQNFSFTRKAAYQYGWDWGPRILTVGIWKPVSLYCQQNKDDPTVENISVSISPITKQSQQITGKIHIQLSHVNAEYDNYESRACITKDQKQIKCIVDKIQQPTNTKSQLDLYFNLDEKTVKDNSLIWWTWDIGKPELVNITVTVYEISSKKKVSEKIIKTGFRTVKVIQKKDSDGQSFVVNLNGYDVFMRGGNYIPPEMSMAKVDPKQYDKIKEYALFAKFNMIRIWGGGQFQHDAFYEAMDQAGILIWHDLMFACAMYPVYQKDGESMLDSIRAEMQDNLWRIGTHPSIGIWNGNNQVWIGWQEWGWKRNLTQQQLATMQNMYKDIFQKVLPETINKITPDIFYWETSPSSSSYTKTQIGNGDIHFWRVWGAGTPIQQYEQFIGRFNSEYGMQSMPDYSTILNFTSESDRNPMSYVMRLHERHPKGDDYLPMYTNKYAGETQDLKRFSYFSQVMQSYALEMAIRSLRGSKPFCMGSLYWQLNDVWPVSSWASVDYYGMYKASHYRIRQAHNQLYINVLHKNNRYSVYLINDLIQKNSLFCQIKVVDLNGTNILNKTIQRTLNPLDITTLTAFNQSQFTQQQMKRSFINMKARSLSGKISQNNYFFLPPVNRTLLDPELVYSIDGKNLTISVKNMANYVWIRSCKGSAVNLQNNYFDMLPGQQITIYLPPNIDETDIQVTCYQMELLKQKKLTQNLMIQQ